MAARCSARRSRPIPTEPDYHFNLAVSLKRHGNSPEALAELNQCLKLPSQRQRSAGAAGGVEAARHRPTSIRWSALCARSMPWRSTRQP